ncbi:hypothetical protein [Arcticibacter sp. MXS-1]|uniref:hypothetical protein n=1 Tax=Arcticibacter sp. MXS-1 TaxID=3341726 RepID=UPI0035A91B50
MKRIFAVLLTLIMLGAGLDLCSAEELCYGKDCKELAGPAKSKQNSDDCRSPFCHCPRCPFSVLISQSRALQAPAIILSVNYPVFEERAVPDVSSSIWQPPRKRS